MIVPALLLVVFLVHLAAFAVLGLRRRQAYYLSLVTTFTLLSASMAVRLVAPESVIRRRTRIQACRGGNRP